MTAASQTYLLLFLLLVPSCGKRQQTALHNRKALKRISHVQFSSLRGFHWIKNYAVDSWLSPHLIWAIKTSGPSAHSDSAVLPSLEGQTWQSCYFCFSISLKGALKKNLRVRSENWRINQHIRAFKLVEDWLHVTNPHLRWVK